MSDTIAGATSATEGGATPAEGVQAQTAPANAVTGEGEIKDPEGAESLGDPGKRALEAMKEQVRASKTRAKELETELERLRNGADQSSESVESKVQQAVAEATARTYFESAIERAGLELDETTMDFFRVEKFVNGTAVDKKAINDFVGLFSPPKKKFAQGVGVGPQASGSAGQWTRQDLVGKTPAEVAQARKDGKLDALMKGRLS